MIVYTKQYDILVTDLSLSKLNEKFLLCVGGMGLGMVAERDVSFLFLMFYFLRR